MGFGFNIFFLFILAPLTVILFLAWLFTGKKLFGEILGYTWLGIFGLITLSTLSNWLTSKIELEKEDYYGEYVINRDYFKGKQSDWQYNHFRFEITEQDSIFFYVTDKSNIVKTFRGKIKTIRPYNSDRLIIEMKQPTHHILTTNPTIYRNTSSFYMVFNSPNYKNMFFKKGEWKPFR